MLLVLLIGTVLLAELLAHEVSSAVGNETWSDCKDRSHLDSCLKELPPILEKYGMKGIPSSKQDVDSACSAFKLGMGCMDGFAKKCLTYQERQTMEAHVAGARHTFKFLCDDPVFQAEYLQYTSCYKGISRDWDNCANRFVSLVREEVSRKNYTMESRLLELCCARHGFLKCVYVASRLKCKKEEALFLKKIADTLSNMRVYSKHCRSVDVAFCGSGHMTIPYLRDVIGFTLLAPILLKMIHL